MFRVTTCSFLKSDPKRPYPIYYWILTDDMNIHALRDPLNISVISPLYYPFQHCSFIIVPDPSRPQQCRQRRCHSKSKVFTTIEKGVTLPILALNPFTSVLIPCPHCHITNSERQHDVEIRFFFHGRHNCWIYTSK